MIKIKEISIPTRGIADRINIVIGSITLPCNYGASIKYYIWNSDATLLDGDLTMPDDIYSQWGTDDNYVIDWVLNKLNLQRDE